MKKIIKKLVNSIRIPSLLSFFISKDGKINPSRKEILAEAPKENWDRMGLDRYWWIWVVIILCLVGSVFLD